MFNAPESDDTIPSYANVVSFITIINYRLVTDVDPLVPPLLNEAQTEAIASLYTALQERYHEDDTRTLVHAALKSMLVYEFGAEQTDISCDPVSMALVWYNWQRDGSFQKASVITQSFAAVQFITRSVVLVQVYTMHKATQLCYYRYETLVTFFIIILTKTLVGN